MKKTLWISSIALAAALAVGCDDSSKTSVDSAVKSAQDTASKAGEQVAAAADKAKDAAAQGFDAIKGQVEDLYNKAVALVNEKKFTEAKGLVDQLATWKDKVPAEWQTKIADLVKKVEDGLKAVGGGH